MKNYSVIHIYFRSKIGLLLCIKFNTFDILMPHMQVNPKDLVVYNVFKIYFTLQSLLTRKSNFKVFQFALHPTGHHNDSILKAMLHLYIVSSNYAYLELLMIPLLPYTEIVHT